VRGVLVDAGPLVAVMDADDIFHAASAATFKEIREPLFTVWPVITEAMHLVGAPEARDALWDVMQDKRLQLLSLDGQDIPRMRALMWKYRDLPMDPADAALVRVAERDGFRRVFTIDRSDFKVYRLHGNERFTILG
jgi:predicted nucleic acid-binding protein